MTDLVNSTPTPKLGTLTLGNAPTTASAPIERAQAIREALSAAQYWLDSPHKQSTWLATAHARRALSLLKQACSEVQIGGAA